MVHCNRSRGATGHSAWCARFVIVVSIGSVKRQTDDSGAVWDFDKFM